VTVLTATGTINMMNLTYYFSGKIIWLSSLMTVIALSGCVSISKGVTLALLEKSEEPDTRKCEGWGKPFEGIEPRLGKERGKTKILMVHGVADHIPGYTTQFQGKLAKELGLNARSAKSKNIELESILFPGKGLGNLRVSRLVNAENGKEVLFYELTWSEITRVEKELLAYDTSGEYDHRRAAVNSIMKKFSNDAISDPLIYGGNKREPIQAAFSQSFCWMLKDDWGELPEKGRQFCSGLSDAAVERMIQDDYIFVSHSLGSRITVDGLQRIAGILPRREEVFREKQADAKVSIPQKVVEALRLKHISIFMFSNQLPLLQLGRELPEVAGKDADYCKPEGRYYNQRMVSETSIIAFSDPNDLLSYGIPPGYQEQYIDSRLCSDITNISINVSPVIQAFGMTAVRPGPAHMGYDQDDRVVALVAHGIGTLDTSPLVKERCEYTPTVD
jgi:hypothetical protein